MEKNHSLVASKESWDKGNLPEYLCSAKPDQAVLDKLTYTKGSETLNAFIVKAILNYSKGRKSEMSAVKIMPGVYATEWKKNDGECIVVYASSTGEISASSSKGECYSTIPTLGGSTNTFDTTSILLAYLMMLADESAFVETDAKAAMEDLTACRDGYKRSLKLPTDEVYRLNDMLLTMLNKKKIPIDILSGNVALLAKDRITCESLSGEVLCGIPTKIMKVNTAEETGVWTIGEAKDKFADFAASREWTDEEKERIAEFPDDYSVMPEVIEIANWYVSSQSDRIPAVNIRWTGSSGIGKSTSVEQLSCILHTPLYRFTCSSSTETDDFLSVLKPVEATTLTDEDLPSIDDVLENPELAYATMTGEWSDGITVKTALDKYIELRIATSSTSTAFKLVKSEYVKALETGAICEIQEASRIRDSGVLVGLNETFEPNALITLSDGTYTRRSPMALTVWTDNVGYDSCHLLDPSVLRRMDGVFQSFELDRKTVIDRVLYNIDNKLDREIVEGMYEVWAKIKAYCKDEDITESELSPNDLEKWASRVVNVGITSIADVCEKTIVNKLTTDINTQVAIIQGVVKPSIERYLSVVA